jgi:hypothetical protein
MAEVEDKLPYPNSLNDLLDTIREYFTGHPKRVLSFHVEIGKPIVARRQYIPGDEDGLYTTPYSILRNRTVVHLQKEGSNPLETIHNMHKQIMSAGFIPTCTITWSDEIFEWVGGEDFLPNVPSDRKILMGTEVYIDRELTKGSIIIAGSSNPFGGIWGLQYGVRYVI